MMISVGQKALWGARVTSFTLVSLVCLFLYWNINRPAGTNMLVWVLQSLPLLLFLPAVWTQQRRALTWLCFVLLLYFVKAVEGVFMSNAGLSDILFLCLTVSTFIVALFTIRWLQQL